MHGKSHETREESATKPKPPRVGRLQSLSDCTREMSKVYRLTRTGQLDSLVGWRLVSILNLLLNGLKTADLEQRIEILENLLDDRNTNTTQPPAGD